MKLQDVITKQYQKKWSYTNNFFIQINCPGNSVHLNREFIKYGEEINMHIQNVDLPDFTGNAIETVVMGHYRMHVSIDQPYRLSITFLDSDNLALWKDFVRQYYDTKNEYFDRIKLEISVYKDDDFDPQGDRSHIITFKDVMIENVNKFPVSNEDDASIAKFAVAFKSNSYTLDN